MGDIRILCYASGWALFGAGTATGQWPFFVGALVVFVLILVQILGEQNNG